MVMDSLLFCVPLRSIVEFSVVFRCSEIRNTYPNCDPTSENPNHEYRYEFPCSSNILQLRRALAIWNIGVFRTYFDHLEIMMAASQILEDHNMGYEDTEEDIDDHSHKKLLNAVSQIYRKQRISAPKRNEPFQQISEFNLTKSNQKKKIGAKDLLRDLNKKATHRHITSKIESIRRKQKPLPKPLEKSEEEKLVRQCGFKAVEQELWKWEALIQRNRAADQLVFPLKDETVKFERNADFLSAFTKPSELELKMAEVMKKSLLCQEGKPDEEPDEKMTLDELFERRNMVAKMRARESYRIAKAVRQNKIKSKKYHRVLKRERIKQELKEFELLQKTDPEAALAKLERVEKARAEERISLRHRNTGKWAKGLALRAKYDSEARAQLADNLRKSREITANLKSSMASDSEDDDVEDVELHEAEKSTENPWVADNEVATFVSGYRKFWENQNKQKEASGDKEPNSQGVIPVGPSSERDDDDDSAGADELLDSNLGEGNNVKTTLNSRGVDLGSNSKKEVKISQETVDLGSGGENTLGIAEDEQKGEQIPGDSENMDGISAVVRTSNSTIDHSELTDSSAKDSNSVTVPRSNRKKRKSKVTTSLDKSGTWSVVEMDHAVERNSDEFVKNCVISESSSPQKKMVKNRSKRNSLNTFEICGTTPGNKVEEKPVDKKRKLGNMFDEVQMSIEEALINKMAESVERARPNRTAEVEHLDKPKRELEGDKSCGRKSNPKDLSFKKSHRPGLDESLIEMAGDGSGVSSGMSEVRKLVDRLGVVTAVPKESVLPDIDPQKFIPVKRQKLDTAIPDFEEGGDSESDDEKEEQHLNLMEAFADDDIADEFRKEKEEEEEDFKEKEIDLSLPGWGSWSGSGIVDRQKNWKKVRFPTIPRKDANRKTIIINEEPSARFTKLKVSDLPQQYNSVAAYEAAIRAPIGDTWVTQLAHTSLIAPQVITKIGAIIEPLDTSVLLQKEQEEKRTKVNLDKARGKKTGDRKNSGKSSGKPKNGPSKKVNKTRPSKQVIRNKQSNNTNNNDKRKKP